MKWYWHAALFNAYWLLLVWFGNTAACLVVFYLVAYRFMWKKPLYGFRAVMISALASLIDLIFQYFDLIAFKQSPYWLVALWLAFSMSFPSVYGPWLTRPHVLYFIAMVGGPLCYYAGQKLGAISVLHLWVYLLWSPLWVGYFAYLIRLARQQLWSSQIVER